MYRILITKGDCTLPAGTILDVVEFVKDGAKVMYMGRERFIDADVYTGIGTHFPRFTLDAIRTHGRIGDVFAATTDTLDDSGIAKVTVKPSGLEIEFTHYKDALQLRDDFEFTMVDNGLTYRQAMKRYILGHQITSLVTNKSYCMSTDTELNITQEEMQGAWE